MKTLKEGFKQFTDAIKNGFLLTVFTSNQLIHLYSKHGLLQDARNLFDAMPERNVFTWNAIISAHIKSHDLTQARAFFDSAPHKDTVTYNSIISGYVTAIGFQAQALEIFTEMQATHTLLDEFTLTTMLHLTSKLSVLSYGVQLHCYMVKTANDSTGFSVSSLIDMYSKCECFSEACRLFNGCCGRVLLDSVSKNAMVAACCREGEMEIALNLFSRASELNDAVSWNTLISGYAQNGYGKEALELFVRMAETGTRWNEHSFASVLSACSSLKSLKHGKEVHAWVLKTGLGSNPFIGSGIVDLYCKSGHLQYAELVHAAIGTNNVFSTTSLIAGHCSQGNMAEARRLFDSLAEKNSVVLTAMVSGYARLQEFEAVFELLSVFKVREAVVLDALVLMSVLGVCAIQAALDPGKQIHACILRNGIKVEKTLSSAMVDMYAKCGDIKYAERVFRRVAYRDRILYNAMIAGYAHHGYENQAIQLYGEMLNWGIKPDAVTHIALLSACRHAGLVEAGEKFFDSMTRDYSILPEIDHYSCMIDLYGRANQLDKAAALMRRIPVELDAVIWGAFLNACRINGNVDLARVAEEELLRIEGDSGARYVQLANVYAAEGKWNEMGRIRRKMRGRGREVKKLAGCSWIYVENRVNIFTSADRSHSEADTIYSILDCLNARFDEETSLQDRH